MKGRCDLLKISEEEIKSLMNPMLYIGRAPKQVEEFIEDEVNPRLQKYENLDVQVELKV